jgi:hypothetical protein
LEATSFPDPSTTEKVRKQSALCLHLPEISEEMESLGDVRADVREIIIVVMGGGGEGG